MWTPSTPPPVVVTINCGLAIQSVELPAEPLTSNIFSFTERPERALWGKQEMT